VTNSDKRTPAQAAPDLREECANLAYMKQALEEQVAKLEIDRAAVAEAHQHIKAGISMLESSPRDVPTSFYRAAHALHHALNDAPPQAATDRY